MFGVFGGIFQFHSSSNRTFSEPDQTPRSAASDLGLCCLSMSHKKDARLIWVNILTIFQRTGGTNDQLFYKLQQTLVY